jgi:hypothetical protein
MTTPCACIEEACSRRLQLSRGPGTRRAREMAAEVTAKHLVDNVFGAMTALVEDPVARVQATANRALARLAAADGDPAELNISPSRWVFTTAQGCDRGE